MKTVSIITVNLNNAKGLEKTIKSIIDQTYINYEFIIIDGGSTDGSLDVIKKYESSISFWISESDTGIFNAMNKGIVKATGQYCYFLNSDDAFASSVVLQAIFEDQEHTEPFICGHQINDFGDSTSRVEAKNRPLSMYDFYWGTIKHQATFIRRDLFGEYGLYDESLRITADWKFFLETIGVYNEQPIYVDVDIVLFAWFGLSTDDKYVAKHDEERLKVINEFVPKGMQADYERLHELENYAYIEGAMKRNKLVSSLVRGVVKIFS